MRFDLDATAMQASKGLQADHVIFALGSSRKESKRAAVVSVSEECGRKRLRRQDLNEPNGLIDTLESNDVYASTARQRRGVYYSIEQFDIAASDFIGIHNGKEAKPFNWKTGPEYLIAARQRGFHPINSFR